jgi:Zn-finger nucleic acid-binding protein
VTSSYRETTLTCPGCGEILAPTAVGDAIIDVCPACGGIWVDWFDGELTAMVKGARARSLGVAPGAKGDASCPRCRRPLDAEQYLESRVEILRCGDCAGAFVPGSAVRTLVALDPEEREPTGAWARLISVLQRWLGWTETSPPGT